jgi:acetoacetyl-CoA synthetase
MLEAKQFDYIYDQVKPDLHLSVMSADSDILGSFVIGNPISPVYNEECQGAALGLDIDVIDQSGESVSLAEGELICRNSFPNQPIGFWHDDGEQYHLAFWDSEDGAWHQGSQAEVTSHGGMRCYGRKS